MSEFEKLIAKNEADLRRIRNQYFPLIVNGTITGYNLYQRAFEYPPGKLYLNYLHSDLKPHNPHFKELSEN